MSGPYHLLLVACPCWHVVTTLERTYATYKAHCYEKASAAYGLWSSVVVVGFKLFSDRLRCGKQRIQWLASIIYTGYVVYLALMDEDFQKPKATMGLMTATSAKLVGRIYYATLIIDLLTSFADVLLLRWNRRKLSRY